MTLIPNPFAILLGENDGWTMIVKFLGVITSLRCNEKEIWRMISGEKRGERHIIDGPRARTARFASAKR